MEESNHNAPASRGTYNLFVGNLLSTILLAFSAIIVARLLGPNEYGLYSIALILPSYVYLILRLGFSSTITRYVAKYASEGKQKKAISFSYSVSIIHLAAGLFVLGLLIPFSRLISLNLFHRPELVTGILIPIALLSVAGQIMFDNGSASFFGLHKFGKSAIIQIIKSVTQLVLSVTLVVLGYSVLGAVVGYSCGLLISGAASLIMIISINRKLIIENVKENFLTTIRYSFQVYGSKLLTTLISPLQITLLTLVVSNTEIGWYGAAQNIAALITLFTYPVANVLLPVFSRNTNGDLKTLLEPYTLSIKYTALHQFRIEMYSKIGFQVQQVDTLRRL